MFRSLCYKATLVVKELKFRSNHKSLRRVTSQTTDAQPSVPLDTALTGHGISIKPAPDMESLGNLYSCGQSQGISGNFGDRM